MKPLGSWWRMVFSWKSECWFIEKRYRAEQCSKTKPMKIQGRENILKDIHKQKWGLNRGGQSQQGNRTTELGGNPKACGKEASVTLTLGCITYYNLSKVERLILVTGPWASMTLLFFVLIKNPVSPTCTKSEQNRKHNTVAIRIVTHKTVSTSNNSQPVSPQPPGSPSIRSPSLSACIFFISSCRDWMLWLIDSLWEKRFKQHVPSNSWQPCLKVSSR